MSTTPTRITPAVMPGAPPIPPRPAVDEEPAEQFGPPGEIFLHGATITLPLVQEPTPAPIPQPPRQPLAGLDRHQHMRRVALELAVRHYHDLECTPEEVLGTAKAWNHWIRTGMDAPTTTTDQPPTR